MFQFQSIESIYEHFVKLEDINVTQISLKLHGKTLKPKDTPRSINYKISDFIGNIYIIILSVKQKYIIQNYNKLTQV